MKALCFGLFVLVSACGAAPDRDPRHADVVAESPELAAAASRAASWWHDATGSEVAFQVVAECSPDRACEHLHVGKLPADEAGSTEYTIGHPEESETTISDHLDPALLDITVAHELGHVLGLAHDDGVMTAVMNDATWKLPKEWAGER